MSDEIAELEEDGIAGQWKALLETLILPTDVEVEDCTGHVHKLRCNLPATVEMRLLTVLQGVFELPMVTAHADKLTMARTKGRTEGAQMAMQAFRAVAGEPAVLQVLSDAFNLAHPKATREGAANVAADPDLMEQLHGLELGGDSLEPQHIFSVADILGGLVPFGVRGVVKGKLTLTAFQTPKT